MEINNYKLDLGCGSKKPDGYIGVDIGYFNYPKGEFVQADINYPLPFKDESFIEIRALQTIEHIDNNKKVEFIKEIYRLLKPDGIFKASFPTPICRDGKSNSGFFTDPTHTAWWLWGTFLCFDREWRKKDINKEIYENGYHINTNLKIIDSRWIDNLNYYIEMIKLREY